MCAFVVVLPVRSQRSLRLHSFNDADEGALQRPVLLRLDLCGSKYLTKIL